MKVYLYRDKLMDGVLYLAVGQLIDGYKNVGLRELYDIDTDMDIVYVAQAYRNQIGGVLPSEHIATANLVCMTDNFTELKNSVDAQLKDGYNVNVTVYRYNDTINFFQPAAELIISCKTRSDTSIHFQDSLIYYKDLIQYFEDKRNY